MSETTSSYRGHRFPPLIISHAVWLYHRFTLSFRDVEDLLAERGVIISYEAVRQRERQMRRFKSPGHAQRFLSVHRVVGNLFRVGRQKVGAENYRLLRDRSFEVWQEVTCAC